MSSKADKLKAIANTLETIMIPATGENVSKMTGIYQLLNEVIIEIENEEAEEHADPAE